jgi:dienelactone hydrolase
MTSKYEAALADYARFRFTDGPWTRPVYRRGSGPAVIVIHEVPGLHPLVIRFADRIAGAGMTVFLLVLFGEAGRPATSGYVLRSMLTAICIHREFKV